MRGYAEGSFFPPRRTKPFRANLQNSCGERRVRFCLAGRLDFCDNFASIRYENGFPGTHTTDVPAQLILQFTQADSASRSM